ncbi:MAG TPA: glycosyltransferase [Pyrinomonadaceae bacterium]|jgi:GT2 family glycosyltransferase
MFTESPTLTPTTEKNVSPRPHVAGKFLFVGEEKLYVRGVTYGTFRPSEDGTQYGSPEVVERDFASMREAGINAVRTYTVPPRWLLDAAARHRLYVMVGLPWEQHVAFLDERGRGRDIERRVREMVRECAGHPSILCYTIGNEIPAPVVRWTGRERVERFLRKLYKAVKEEDPEGLVTYVNYPSTEYLQLGFVDFVCFNVYLETQDRLEAYLSRLQNLAGDRPLVMAEIGLDSRRNGEEKQAEVLSWQIRTVFERGCAGAFVFAWTDEWWRGGFDIEDWDFGLVTREREPKQALASVSRAFEDVPFPKDTEWPPISVVVCSYNGGRVIRDCMEGLLRVEYPNFEVIVVDDGSTDDTAAIVSEYPARLISTENRGLSSARNTGMLAATGEIVAYTDDDARPDPHWLQYLANTFMRTKHAGVGGPNIAPAGDGWIADCVANAPGGPVHVLLSDEEAEHIPGCNMAFRREALLKVGGCDPVYRQAGDDVDLCWRIEQECGTLGFSPAAMVWHHRRNSVGMYWKQQQGYGKAEALLEEKWPEKYNVAGHLTWTGRLYGKGLTQALLSSRSRIYQGTWGSGLFQSIYEPAPGTLVSLPLMPEWYLVIAALVFVSLLGLWWTPLLVALPTLVFALGALLLQAVSSTRKAHFTSRPATRLEHFKLHALTALFHLMQPLARLRGRIRFGLTPWRRRGTSGLVWPAARTETIWSETWHEADERLRTLEESLRGAGACVLRGGDFDAWDLEVRGGMLGSVRVQMMTEEHGGGKQLARFRARPRSSQRVLAIWLLFVVLPVLAALDGAWMVGFVLATVALLFALRAFAECAAAMSTLVGALVEQRETERAAEATSGDATETTEVVPETREVMPETGGLAGAETFALETMAAATREPIAEAPRVAAAAAAATQGSRGAATVPPSAVSSVGSSLFLNQLPVEAASGVAELQHHRLPKDEE